MVQLVLVTIQQDLSKITTYGSARACDNSAIYSRQSLFSSVRNFSPSRQFSYLPLSQQIYQSTRVKYPVHSSDRARRKFISYIQDP